jgi:hypothetical protein
MALIGNPLDASKKLVFAETTYRRSPPSLYGARFVYPELGSWFYKQISMGEQVSPPIYMYELDSVILIDGSFIYDPNHDGFLGFSCLDENLPALSARMAAIKDSVSFLEDYLLDKCVHYDPSDPVVHFSKAGYANYGHFIVEMLPKLLVFREFGMTRINLLVPQCAMKFDYLLRTVSTAVGIKANLCNIETSSIFRCKRLFACSPISRHPVQKNPILKSVASFLSEDLLRNGAADEDHSIKKIFVNRGANDKRRFINDEEVRRIHFDRGFCELVPSLDHLQATARLFASAKIISGGLGAGLSNLIFSQPGSTALLIYPGYHDLFFWDLACLFDLSTIWMFSAPIDDWSEEIDNCDFEVDSDLLSTIVRRF